MICRRRNGYGTSLVFFAALALLPIGCGSDDQSQSNNDEQTLQEALRPIGRFTAIQLDTAAIAAAVRAGESVELPFARHKAKRVEHEVRLTVRNLRNPALTAFVMKDGDAGSYSSVPLPPPATYQGKVTGGGTAVFTVTDAAIEGSMLVAPDGWAFIEPLEPQLRLRNVEPGARERLLRKYNHIIYNSKDIRSHDGPDDNPEVAGAPLDPVPVRPLVMSIVAYGDAELLRAFPLDSVMPFWLKEETILNAVDWQFNCLEPDANAANAYANCGNDFDGGSNAFQARLRIDGLEVWSSGGPDSSDRILLMQQSAAMTHQASPPCCGEPHTAGRANLVHFFSGKGIDGGYATVNGLNYYGPRCFEQNANHFCHHGVSQLIPDKNFRGSAFHQQALVTHEIGHNVGGEEIMHADPVCWLFGEECGTSLMESGLSGFTSRSIFLYGSQAEPRMGPLMAQELEPDGANP